MVDFSELSQTTPLRTRGGRRYINIASRYDLMIREQKKHKKHKKHKRRTLQMGDRPDVMPDVLRAIECVRKKDFAGVKSANKRSDYPSLNETIIYNYTIGCSDEGLG